LKSLNIEKSQLYAAGPFNVLRPTLPHVPVGGAVNAAILICAFGISTVAGRCGAPGTTFARADAEPIWNESQPQVTFTDKPERIWVSPLICQPLNNAAGSFELAGIW